MGSIVWAWITENPYLALTIGIAIAEFGVRLTPTEKDDGFVQRLGALLKTILDTVKIPNNTKKKSIEVD